LENGGRLDEKERQINHSPHICEISNTAKLQRFIAGHILIIPLMKLEPTALFPLLKKRGRLD